MAGYMVKVDRLRGTFKYKGTSYGPGTNIEIPAGLARVLGKKPIEAAAAKEAAPAASAAATPAPATPYDGLSEAQVTALKEAGYRGKRSLEKASDEDLAGVAGIGPVAIEKLRANLKG